MSKKYKFVLLTVHNLRMIVQTMASLHGRMHFEDHRDTCLDIWPFGRAICAACLFTHTIVCGQIILVGQKSIAQGCYHSPNSCDCFFAQFACRLGLRRVWLGAAAGFFNRGLDEVTL